MLSIVVFTLWHGEGTDPVHHFIEAARIEIPELSVMEYDMRIDCDDAKVTPDAITAMLDSCSPWKVEPIDYAKGMDDTQIAQELIDMGVFKEWYDGDNGAGTLPEFYNKVMREAANA